MKKFFAIVPLQKELKTYRYEAVGNRSLQSEHKTAFPILNAIRGYVKAGETFEVIAVVGNENPFCIRNLAVMREEITAFCTENGCTGTVHEVPVTNDQQVTSQAAAFQKLIDYVSDDDELFACMTYGTKPQSTALLMAVQYAYRIKHNTSIDCVVYGEVRRVVNDAEEWNAYVYDMTALIQLGEVVNKLAEQGVADPKAIIDRIITQ